MIILKVIFILVLGAMAQSIELKSLKTIVSFLNGDFLEPKNREDEDATATTTDNGPLKGVCFYNFVDHISHRYDNECSLYDNEIAHLKDGSESKPPIVVKCIPNDVANATLLMPDSVKEILALLKPVGNSTKRNVEGSCVLILFYYKSCPYCVRLAPLFNPFPSLYPSLKMAAIDAHKFHSFNTEFGIVGVPTILLFHQGRPVMKFMGNYWDLGKFITRHTGLTIRSDAMFMSIYMGGPLPVVAEESPDYYLLLAWAFIIVCAVYYFSMTAICKQMIDMIKRNWREAQMEHS